MGKVSRLGNKIKPLTIPFQPFDKLYTPVISDLFPSEKNIVYLRKTGLPALS
jgi:hypothetical protein